MMSYRLLMFVLWPLLALYTLRTARRYTCSRYFKQRLGYGYSHLQQQPLWIHCASVGEANTLRPLLNMLVERFPQHRWLITTNTVTGANTVETFAMPRVQHCYLPVDSGGAIRRFLRAIKPQLAIILETELWPLLYQQCHREGITLCLINGRLSAKTLHAGDWIKARYREALARVDFIFCRSNEDRAGFARLGMNEQRMQTVGNLKFDQPVDTQLDDIEQLIGRNYVLAASTHHNEEALIAQVWHDIDTKGHLLVIAPRHPERAPEILQQLKILNLKVAQRSRGDLIDDSTDVYLADTLGELRRFMNNAALVFIGGSLIPHGGHNLLEPAALGNAIMVGPHMDNFADETRLLLSHRACIQLKSVNQLASVLEKLLIDEQARTDLGHAAKQVMQQQAQVAAAYLQQLEQRYADQLDR